MTTDSTDLSSFNAHISENIKAFRAKRNFTQQQLSKLAGIPRTTLTNIESGQSNPSLSNVIKISSALNVSIDLLVGPPRAQTTLIKAGDQHHELKGGTTITKLLPDKIKGVDFDRVQLPAGHTFKGTPHLSGTHEYMTVISGEVIVRLNGEQYHLFESDLLAFPGDVHHSYQNAINQESVYMSIVIPN